MTVEVKLINRKHDANCVVGVFWGPLKIWTERSNQTERHRGENERKHVATTREFYPFPSLLGPSLFWEGCCLPRSKSVQDRPLRFRLCLFVYRRKKLVVGWLVLDDIVLLIRFSSSNVFSQSKSKSSDYIYIYIYLFMQKKTSTLWVFQTPCHHPERWPLVQAIAEPSLYSHL